MSSALIFAFLSVPGMLGDQLGNSSLASILTLDSRRWTIVRSLLERPFDPPRFAGFRTIVWTFPGLDPKRFVLTKMNAHSGDGFNFLSSATAFIVDIFRSLSMRSLFPPRNASPQVRNSVQQ